MLGRFVFTHVKNYFFPHTVTAAELTGDMTFDEIYNAITEAYMSNIDDYTNGSMSHDEMRRKIAKMIGEYLSSTNGFTDSQIEYLNTTIEEYISNTTINEDIQKNKNDIKELTKLIDDKYKENQAYAADLAKNLQEQLDNSTNTGDSRYNEVNNLIKNLDNYTKGSIADTSNNLKQMIKDLQKLTEDNVTELNTTIETQGKDFQEQIDAINAEIDTRFSDNDANFNFGYDPETGAYGYYVGGTYNSETGTVEGGTFKPW